MKPIVHITDEHQYLSAEQQQMIQKLFHTAAEMEEQGEGEVALSLVNNEEIQTLNRDYRDKDQPTDVLSFPMYEAEEEEIEGLQEDEPLLLGDIIISVPKALEQAKEYGHSFERELGFLTVHGFLHLLGYEHASEEDEKLMFAKQEKILETYGLVR